MINQYVYAFIKASQPAQTFENKLAQYEENIEATRQRNTSVRRVEKTSPSHSLADYAGSYVHPAYGEIQIRLQDRELVFQRNDLVLPLQHWHYDAWIVKDNDLFVIHISHAFDRASRWLFDTNADGVVSALSIKLEPGVAPIRFGRK